MQERTTGSGRRWIGAIGVLLIALGVFGPGLSAGAAAQRKEAPLDLAAMALLPADLEEIGLEGYGNAQGEQLTPEQTVDWLAGEEWITFVEADNLVEEAEIERAYFMMLAKRTDPDNEVQDTSSGAFYIVYEFADDEAAEDGFAILESEAETGGGFDELEDVDGAETIGEESELTRVAWDEETTGDPLEELEIGFRTENIVVGINLWDVARPGEASKPEAPAVEDLETLAGIVLDRVETVLDGDAAGLSNQVLRLAEDEPDITTCHDMYLAQDGEAIAIYRETPSERREFEDFLDEFHVRDNFTFEQCFAENFSSPGYQTRLLRFEDEDAATEWYADQIDGFTGSVDELEEIAEGDGFGDESVVYHFVDGRDEGYMAFLQTGDIALRMLLEVEDVDAEVFLGLVEAQAECVDGGGCIEPIPAPDGVL